MKSILEKRGPVPFADTQGERVYMLPFTQAAGLPASVAHWQPTVNAMLNGIAAPGPIYFMVDQGYVRAGSMLRRPGPHVDGYWVPGGPHDTHRAPLSMHRQPGHRSPVPSHSPPVPRHGHTDNVKEAIILASNVTGCAGYVGRYVPNYGKGGACLPSDIARLDRVEIKAGHAWAGNVGFVHESTPMERDVYRTVVRLNVPGWEPV